MTGRYEHLRHNARRKLALLIGGDAKGTQMSEQYMKIVLHQISSMAQSLGLDLLVSTSRRTPAFIEQLVLRELKDHPRTALLIIANKNNVPEAVGGMLGLADLVIVSGDSVSMISEAASSGKKTIVFPVGPAKEPDKYAHFCRILEEQGHILYAQPTGVAAAMDTAVKNKIVTKPVKDSALLLEALRKIVR